MQQPPASPGLQRRAWFAGAGALGAAVVAAQVAPAATSAVPVAQAQPVEPPTRGGGYQHSEHVERYYRSARV